MNLPFHPRVLCTIVAVVSVLLSVTFALRPHGGRVTGLIRMQPDEPIAQLALEAHPDFAFVPAGHYDGVYAYAIARDPLATGRAHELIDLASYRYGRAGYGWVTWVLSLGRASLVPLMLLLVGVVGVVGGTYLASVLAERLGYSPWGGLVVALNPGVLFGLTVDTSEPLTALLIPAALLLWLRGRLISAAAVMALVALTKEPFVMLAVGIALWELARRRRGADIPDLGRRLLLLGASLVPLAAWWAYVRARLGVWPFETDPPFLSTVPLSGWFDSISRASHLGMGNFDQTQIGPISMVLIISVGVALVLAALRSLRFRTPLDGMLLGLAALTSLYSWYQLLYPKELFRVSAIAISLIPAMFASPAEDAASPVVDPTAALTT